MIPSPLRRAYWEWRRRRLSRSNTLLRPGDLPPRSSKDEIRAVWVLAGNEWLGSARVKGTLIHKEFLRLDGRVLSRIAYMPKDGDFLRPALEWDRKTWMPLLRRGVDLVSFQTRTGATADLLRDCRDMGIATVFSISDRALDSISQEVLDLTGVVVVSSESLARLARERHPRVAVIDDPIEVPCGLTRVDQDRGRRPELVWLGHAGHWGHVGFLREVLDCEDLRGLSLKTISRHPEATYQWNPRDVWEQARHSDIAVIPCDLDEWGQAKSSNRLVCFMALGYPVVSGPIPAYREHVHHGTNGFFAVSVEEWRDCLRLLLDPDLRKDIGERARTTHSLETLRLERIAREWERVFEAECRRVRLGRETVGPSTNSASPADTP